MVPGAVTVTATVKDGLMQRILFCTFNVWCQKKPVKNSKVHDCKLISSFHQESVLKEFFYQLFASFCHQDGRVVKVLDLSSNGQKPLWVRTPLLVEIELHLLGYLKMGFAVQLMSHSQPCMKLTFQGLQDGL